MRKKFTLVTEKGVRKTINEMLKNGENPVCIKNCNSKLGKTVYGFSTLAGNENYLPRKKDGTLVCEIPGTCNHHCNGCIYDCYAFKNEIYHCANVPQAWARNTILLRDGVLFDYVKDFIKEKEKTKTPIKVFRINVSGEITSLKEFIEWNKLAKEFPNIQFGVYTKETKELIRFAKRYKQSEPNFVINVSLWNHNVDKDIKILQNLGFKFNIFEYDGSNKINCNIEQEDALRMAKLLHCPGITRQGKHAKTKNGKDFTCDKCNLCYMKTGKHIACWSH